MHAAPSLTAEESHAVSQIAEARARIMEDTRAAAERKFAGGELPAQEREWLIAREIAVAVARFDLTLRAGTT